MDEVTIQNRVAYDRIAGDFAARNPDVPTTYLAMADEFQRRADGPLLDLGCGPGRDLAYWTGRGARAVGLDLSAAMLRAARERVAVPLVQGDLLRLPFRAGTFGGVWCSASLLHLPKASAPTALADIRRVVRPDGPLLLSVKEGEGERWERWPGESADRYFAWYRQEEIERLLIGAGFTRCAWPGTSRTSASGGSATSPPPSDPARGRIGQMRYLIIGAGAVGGTIGVRLAEGGHDVTLVARGPHLDAIRERGLTLRTPRGTVTARLPALAGPDDRPLAADTVLVLTVKSQDTEAALATWVDTPVDGGGTAGERLPLFVAQNGVDNERAALRLFARVHPVCVWLPATHLEPGVVVANGHPHPGMLHLGRYPSGSDDTSRAVAGDLTGAGFVAPVRDDVMRWKYGKLLSNLGNGLQALFGRDVPDAIAGRAGAEGVAALAERARAEGVAALAAAGIAHTSPEEEAAERGDKVRHRPVDGEERAGGSTWQSLARGAGSAEADHLNGEIVLLGRLHGVPTPVNAAVQLAVRRAVRERIPAGGFPLAELEKMTG